MLRAVASIILVFTLGIMLINPSTAGYSTCCLANPQCSAASDCTPTSTTCAAPCHSQMPMVTESRLAFGDSTRSAHERAGDDGGRGAMLEPAIRPPI